MANFEMRRTVMVDTQVRPSDVTKFPIIQAMLSVAREDFVPTSQREAAYMGENIDLGHGRVVLEPRTLAKMLDTLDIGNDELVLDVGTGYGYSAAVIAHMAEAVVAVEEDEDFAREAQEALIRSERLAGVGRMAAGLAHEVGNPLAAVLATVDLLEDGIGDPNSRSEMLMRARIELERIHVIIQSLLGYAHTGSGTPSSVDAHEVVCAAVATVQHQPIFQDKNVRVEGVAGVNHVWMEKGKLHQDLRAQHLVSGSSITDDDDN